MEFSSKKSLGFFELVMINVIAVDSIRTLSFSAVYGLSLVFFYALAALLFFFPTAFVSAELGTGWPNRGGIYVWVREAFGKKWSFIAIWLNWLYNVIWFPTIMALIAGVIAYLFDPALAENKYYMCGATLILFWGATGINCLGMKASSWLSTTGAILGTLLPMLFIGLLGMVWFFQGKPMQIQFSWKEFFPSGLETGNLAFLTNVLFGLLGLEMAATHAAEMKNPLRDYPRSLFVSAGIILVTIVFGSLAIAAVVPKEQLSLATGIMQAFQIFCDTFGMSYLLPLIAVAIILGGLSCVGAWIIGPTKGLLVACEDKSLPPFFAKTNAQGVPARILVMQGCLTTLLSLLFIFLPTVNSSYWILSVITAQLALVVYGLLFAAALRLHYKKAHVKRSFKMPGKTWGAWTICSLGIMTCLAVIGFGFLPPAQVPYSSPLIYELILVFAIALSICIPIFWIERRRK